MLGPVLMAARDFDPRDVKRPVLSPQDQSNDLVYAMPPYIKTDLLPHQSQVGGGVA